MPAYDVAAWLPACLDSILASEHRELDVVVVDDGSPDDCGEIAEAYARRDARLRVVHTENRGLGAARNEGLRHVRGDVIGFCDSDDVVPATAYAAMLAALGRSRSDFVTGSIVRWEGDGLHEPPWMRRLHTDGAGLRLTADDHPEILGDVFAWNKLFRREFWDRAGLSWPEGLRYEDQPATTRAYLLGQFDVLPDIVYHWRIRTDGTSITQQRSSVRDLADRVLTKRMSLASVRELGGPDVERVFVDRVLAGDLWRYFSEIPGCSDEWWNLLRDMVREFWGERTLVESFLPPAQRVVGWLVGEDRRADAARLVAYAAGLGHPVPRITDGPGGPGGTGGSDGPDGPDGSDGPDILLDIPPEVIDPTTLPRAVVLLRRHET